MMTHNSNAVIAWFCTNSCLAGLAFSLPFPCHDTALPSFSPFLVVAVGVGVVVVAAVVVLTFKLLYLVEICALRSAF